MPGSTSIGRRDPKPGSDQTSDPDYRMNASLQVQGIYKKFPGVQALHDVSFSIKAGEVHVLVGENGAGKSTLTKILSGAIQPDSGSIQIDGQQVFLKDPKTAVKTGIATIYQEFSLIPWMSVANNLFLGRENIVGKYFLSRRKMQSESKKILDKIEVSIDPDTKVIELGVAEQQLIEISRAISQNTKFILMDEPTASLTEKEIGILFQKILNLKESGVGILYISHRLEEIQKIADRVTVMRDGAVTYTGAIHDITLDQIIARMVGRSIGNHYPKRKNEPGELLLEVIPPGNSPQKNDRSIGPKGSFYARAGEVVGIAGLVGSGRTEWAMRVFGANPLQGEKILIAGKNETNMSPRHARDIGLGMVPENRKEHGIIPGQSVRKNITITILERIKNLGFFIDRKKQSEISKDYIDKLSLRCSSDSIDIEYLSGGNQQKAVLAKWLACGGKIIILDEPTRGIDIGAKQEIYNLINDMCSEGKAVVLISSDLPELLSMSDRIYIMHQGGFVADFSTSNLDQETVMQYASGIKRGMPNE